jgi:hypothetical protein
MVTPLEPPDPGAVASAVLDNLRAALTEIRTLSAHPSADPFYARSVEQVAELVAELEKRALPPAADKR